MENLKNVFKELVLPKEFDRFFPKNRYYKHDNLLFVTYEFKLYIGYYADVLEKRILECRIPESNMPDRLFDTLEREFLDQTTEQERKSLREKSSKFDSNLVKEKLLGIKFPNIDSWIVPLRGLTFKDFTVAADFTPGFILDNADKYIKTFHEGANYIFFIGREGRLEIARKDSRSLLLEAGFISSDWGIRDFGRETAIHDTKMILERLDRDEIRRQEERMRQQEIKEYRKGLLEGLKECSTDFRPSIFDFKIKKMRRKEYMITSKGIIYVYHGRFKLMKKRKEYVRILQYLGFHERR